MSDVPDKATSYREQLQRLLVHNTPPADDLWGKVVATFPQLVRHGRSDLVGGLVDGFRGVPLHRRRTDLIEQSASRRELVEGMLNAIACGGWISTFVKTRCNNTRELPFGDSGLMQTLFSAAVDATRRHCRPLQEAFEAVLRREIGVAGTTEAHLLCSAMLRRLAVLRVCPRGGSFWSILFR